MATTARRARVGLSRFVTDNLGLKVISIGLALMLFSLVHSDVDAQRSIYFDVEPLLPASSSGKMLISELPTQVRVTLRGSRSKLSTLTRDQLPPVQVDLRNEEASGNYYFDPRAIEVGGNIQVIDIVPPSVPLTWAKVAEKRVPVQVELQGELDKRLSLAREAQADPAQVTLRGPEQRLQSERAVATEPVSLSGLGAGTHRRRVALTPLPDHVTYVEDTGVEVSLVVAPVVADRTFRRLEVAAIGDEHWAVRPEHVAITVRGPQEQLDELEPELLVPYVEPGAGSPAASRAYDVKVRGVPDGIEVVRITPPSVLGWLKGR